MTDQTQKLKCFTMCFDFEIVKMHFDFGSWVDLDHLRFHKFKLDLHQSLCSRYFKNFR